MQISRILFGGLCIKSPVRVFPAADFLSKYKIKSPTSILSEDRKSLLQLSFETTNSDDDTTITGISMTCGLVGSTSSSKGVQTDISFPKINLLQPPPERGNDEGVSFDGETLTYKFKSSELGEWLIVNGYNVKKTVFQAKHAGCTLMMGKDQLGNLYLKATKGDIVHMSKFSPQKAAEIDGAIKNLIPAFHKWGYSSV